MVRFLLILILISALLFLLYLTNPTKQAFAARYADEISVGVAQELGLGSTLGGLLGGAARGPLEEALIERTRRDNFFVASLFRLPTSGEDLRVVGIAGRFIPLDD